MHIKYLSTNVLPEKGLFHCHTQANRRRCALYKFIGFTSSVKRVDQAIAASQMLINKQGENAVYYTI